VSDAAEPPAFVRLKEAATPMVYLVSIIPIPNYEAWKADLDGAQRALSRLGVSRHWIYRGADDPNEVMTVFELPSLEHAQRFLKSTELDVPAWMDRIGLEIYPTFFVGEQTEVVDYPAPAPRA
jgi:hypothetical protein